MVAAVTERAPLTIEQVQTRRAELHLRNFVRQAWHIVEPATEYQHNWHIDALCDHLEATLTGGIRNLLVTMPPRAMKSLVISVFFPAWAWVHKPELRFLYASYAQSLSTEHSQLTRMVIESEWYQARWGHIYQLADDDNLKTRFSNTARGYRVATSVGASVTGFGGDYVICLPEDETVWTEAGPMPIGDIVRERREVRVWSHNQETGVLELKPIEGWHTNPGSEIVEVGLSDGAVLRCTPDHRIWTRNRGWVEAQSLVATDVLPDATIPNRLNGGSLYTEPSPEGATRFSRLQDDANVRFGELASVPTAIRRETNPVSDISPDDAISDVLDGGTTDAVATGERLGSVGTSGDLADLFLGQHSAGAAIMEQEGAVSLGIADVLGAGAVGKIAEDAVAGVAVEMSDLVTDWAWANKSSHEYLMDVEMHRATVSASVESRVSLVRRRLEDSVRDGERFAVSQGSAPVAADPAKVRDAVQTLESGDRSPLFVRHHSFAASTYCITVADHHNFVAGDKIIIANCDDPHNVQQAESTAVRQAAVDWWNRAMSTRLNNPRTGVRIVVMQRVHEDDVAGSVIDKGGYDHLNLPMEYEGESGSTSIGWSDPRTEPGELLWPSRYDANRIAQFKADLGSYAYAAQFQQRPAPLEGGILKRDWFRYYDQPANVYMGIIQAWDTAFKTGADNDSTACVTIGLSANIDVLDVYQGKVEFPDLERVVQEQHLIWSTRYPGVPITVLVEDKGSGQSLIQAARRWPHRNIAIIPVPASRPNEKAQRVNEISPTVEAGKVRFPVGAWWLDAVLHELTTFPFARHDDVTDAFAIGVRRAVGIDTTASTVIDTSAFAPVAETRRDRARRFRRGER